MKFSLLLFVVACLADPVHSTVYEEAKLFRAVVHERMGCSLGYDHYVIAKCEFNYGMYGCVEKDEYCKADLTFKCPSPAVFECTSPHKDYDIRGKRTCQCVCPPPAIWNGERCVVYKG